MKTKLFTTNIYLGVLLAFVLMLGVQGTAGALSTPSISWPTDLSRQNQGFTFTVTIPSSFNKASIHEKFQIILSSSDSTVTLPDATDVTGAAATGWTEKDTNLSDSNNGTSFGSGPALGTKLTIKPALGESTVTVKWTTSSATTSSDLDGERIRTFYVVNPTDTAATSIAFDTTTTDTNDDGIELKSTGDHTIDFTIGGTSNIPITVTATGGGLFVQKSGRTTSRVSTLHTSSDATVKLRLTSTSTITVSHRRSVTVLPMSSVYQK